MTATNFLLFFMKNSKKLKTPKTEVESESKDQKKDSKNSSKFGILGKDLSSRFSAGGDRAWKPTKPGGRNGNGKP